MSILKPRQKKVTARRPLRAKLIFNASAGRPEESADQLAELLTHLQAQYIQPDVFMVRPESRLPVVAREAVRRGAKLVIVSGGDGTIESVATALVGTPATLGIIPTGTRNNLALSLGIPTGSVADAVKVIRQGRRIKIDVGQARSGYKRRWFLEVAAAGLVPALYSAADEIQHGKLDKLGDFLSTLVSYPPSQVHLTLDGRYQVNANVHLVLIANMPFMGANFQVAPHVRLDDGRLDVLVFSNVSKLELIGYAMQVAGGVSDDPRIARYRVNQAVVEAEPKMAVMVDGELFGESPLHVSVRPRGLLVIVGPKARAYYSQGLGD